MFYTFINICINHKTLVFYQYFSKNAFIIIIVSIVIIIYSRISQYVYSLVIFTKKPFNLQYFSFKRLVYFSNTFCICTINITAYIRIVYSPNSINNIKIIGRYYTFFFFLFGSERPFICIINIYSLNYSFIVI